MFHPEAKLVCQGHILRMQYIANQLVHTRGASPDSFTACAGALESLCTKTVNYAHSHKLLTAMGETNMCILDCLCQLSTTLVSLPYSEGLAEAKKALLESMDRIIKFAKKTMTPEQRQTLVCY
jgi:hypothetical protein